MILINFTWNPLDSVVNMDFCTLIQSGCLGLFAPSIARLCALLISLLPLQGWIYACAPPPLLTRLLSCSWSWYNQRLDHPIYGLFWTLVCCSAAFFCKRYFVPGRASRTVICIRILSCVEQRVVIPGDGTRFTLLHPDLPPSRSRLKQYRLLG